jgi:3-hydroxyisobutyrate dehydrogenase
MKKTVAFIGLGNMGRPMALNLLKAEHPVRGFDLVTENMISFAAAGGVHCQSAQEAVEGADVVISMLPASAHVEALYLDEDGLLDHIKPGIFVIDCSTIAPATAIKVSKEAWDRKRIRMIDAPVSGGTGGATAGTLTFMIGGEEADFKVAQQILAPMGKNFFHAGPHGSGQITKICNNMLLAIHMIGTSEALNLGTSLGMDAKVLSEIMAKSSGRNWSLEVYNPQPGVMENVPSSRGYEGGFAVDLMAKDLGLAVEAATQARVSTPLGSLATDLYRMVSAHGSGRLDFSSVLRFLKPTKK